MPMLPVTEDMLEMSTPLADAIGEEEEMVLTIEVVDEIILDESIEVDEEEERLFEQRLLEFFHYEFQVLI